jgi:drug/metabolite transporter (DMT)-like permease
MTPSQIFRLFFAAAVWGSSHVLVRISAPEIGASLTAFSRILIAAITLSVFIFSTKLSFNLKTQFKDFLVVGILNAAMPLFLFAYASLVLPASYLVILNATMPAFSAIFSSLFLGDSFTTKKVCGIVLGMGGIVLLSQFGTVNQAGEGVAVAMGAGLLASASYGACSVYVKSRNNATSPVVLTAGSNWVGAMILLPFAAWFFGRHGSFEWVHHSFSTVVMALMILGIFGSGIAFVVFYKLIAEVGAFRSSLVSFLSPVFGLFWGWIFLSEVITPGMLLGVAMILAATSLFMKLPKRPFAS